MMMTPKTKNKLLHQLIELITSLENCPDNRCLTAKETSDLKHLIDHTMRRAAHLYIELENTSIHDEVIGDSHE